MSPPMCQCGKPATRYETKKPGPNQGRYFFKCASRKCSLFKWDDTTPAAVTNDATTDSTQPSPVHQNIPSWATPPEPDAAKPKRITAGGGGNSTVTFSIHSPTHLSLTARHCPSLIPVLRTIPNSTWEAASQTSFLPLSLPAYNSAVNHLREAQDIKVKIVPLDPHLLRTLSQDENPETKNRRMARTLQVEEEIRAKVRPEGLWEKLMPFQKEGVVEAVVRGGRVLLGDEMGLGKTIQSLTLCSFYSAHWPALILCPSSLRLTWRGEITQWLDVREDEVHVVFTGKDGIEGGSEGGPRKERKKAKSRSKAEGKAKKRKVVYSDEGEQETEEEEEKEEEEEETEVEKARPKKFVIMSYDLVSKYEKQLAEKRFQIVIADESHFLKNRETKRTKAVLPILQSARYVFLLSGTPAFSRPVELWTQLHVLDHQAFSTFFSFAKRYCDAKQGKYGWDYTGSSNLQELNFILNRTVLIRRLKRDVALELPSKTRQIIHVQADNRAQREVDKLKKHAQELETRIMASRGDDAQDKMEKRRTLLEMYSESGRAKIPAVKEYLSELYENSQKKFLIFAHHVEVMDAISGHLEAKHHASYIRIDGTTNQRIRQDLCDRFQADSNVRVAVLSITAANVGLTLHAADMVIFAELFWNPSQLMQAEDRAHRIGRTQCVDVKYILAMSTLDGMQWPLIRHKLEVVGQTLDGSKTKVNMDASFSTVPSKEATFMHSHFLPTQQTDDAEDGDGSLLKELEMANGDGLGVGQNEMDDDRFQMLTKGKKRKVSPKGLMSDSDNW